MATGTTRPYHHGNLRAALLERAEQTLAERGSGPLSLRELAREIGVSHAAPRRHFAGKQALLDALAEDGFHRLGSELRAAVAGAGAGAALEGRLAALGRAYVGFATRHAALLELMFAGKHRPGAEACLAAADEAFAAPLALFEDGQRSGELAPGDPERIAMLAFATLQGLTAMANGGMLEPQELDALVTDAVAQLLDGLRPR